MAAHLSTDLYLLCVVLIGSIALAQGQQSEVVQDQAQLDQYGQVAPPSVETIGASQNYRDFVRGYLQYVAEVTPPYPPIPGGNKLPPLQERYRADVEWVRSTGRGPEPAIVRGRPWSITPMAQDPLQDGEVASLPPGAPWVSRLPKDAVAGGL